MLDPLEGTSELTAAAGARAFLAGCDLLAHDIRVQRARALLREMEFPGIVRPLVEDDIDHLRNHIAGALDHDGVADPDVAPLAQHLALAADTLDVVLIMQGDVLHDHAADA